MAESTSAAQQWTPPPVGNICWIEIPAVDVPACKVFGQLYIRPLVLMISNTISLQKFYASLFPSWSFTPATKEYTEDKIAMWKFAEPSGKTDCLVVIANTPYQLG
jgi:hypothetical protein